jgi:subtilase family serine protease
MRVYLYDVNNKRPLLYDYNDGTTNALDSKYNKYIHGGIAQLSADGRVVQYKIRITKHINNIITKDSTNVKLALVVTENINETGNAALRNPFTEQVYFAQPADPSNVNVKTVPVSSVMNPFGTILYGTNPAVPEDKRARLEIFYTKPE